MTKKRPVIGDPLQHGLNKIDVEIAGLEKAIAEKVAGVDADRAKHALDQDGDLQQRLNDQIRVLRGRVDQMQQKRFDVELGELAPKKPVVAASPTRSKKKWDIKNVPAPTYPIGARQRGDKAALDAAFMAFLEYHIDQAKITMQRHDVDAAGRASIDLLMDVAGEHLGMHVWMSERVKELETRLAEIEARPTVKARDTGQPLTKALEKSVTRVTKFDGQGRIAEFEKVEGPPEDLDLLARVEALEARPTMAYRGVWGKGTEYHRGDVCTHQGSSWHCELDAATGLQPGDGLGWKLMVKKGRDARP
ncbi:hypothetical protein MesoLj131c_47140 [Mesorhizobium sp. 131-3-5]|uniref:hypothetical protein n=1 Tax=Mesorhizobium sp. 131-3-5 TaxID=2744520 RepID=UPI001927B1F3|nr:hypothetical protein [Mesorhizobium sp. 131-3-5]BCH10456.1 hypothetical protein MesoLj131c_47140 [Mesorhizobium sp. 131-3-5]